MHCYEQDLALSPPLSPHTLSRVAFAVAELYRQPLPTRTLVALAAHAACHLQDALASRRPSGLRVAVRVPVPVARPTASSYSSSSLALPYPAGVVLGAGDDGVALVVEGR